jgi:ABC-type lipoprotein release transport system permease subunit
MHEMGTVRMLARSEVRGRWRSTVLLAVLVGVVGALVLAAAAGARRSDTALERFNAFSRSSDLEVSVGFPTPAQLDEFERSAGVAAFARLHGYSLGTAKFPELAMATPVDGAMGDVVDRARVISGREADPHAPTEITIGEGLASSLHLQVGSVLHATSYTQQQIDEGFSGKQVGGPAGPGVQLRVVGIVRRPLDLGVRSSSGGVVLLSPAFNEVYGKRVGIYTDVLRVRAQTPADLPRVESAARRIFGKAYTFQEQPLGIEAEGARNAIDVLTLTLWIFAGVAALAGAVAIGIVLTRDVMRSSLDPLTLRGLGITRRQVITASAARAVIVAVGGAVAALLLAIALSPRLPVGLARRADPDVGVHADWAVLGLGAALIVVMVLGIAFVAAWRVIHTTAQQRGDQRRRASSTVEIATRAGLRPAATNGLRMALESGRGNSSVPVRSGIGGAILGIAGVTAVLVFAGSLTHLVDTPRLAGWVWNLRAEVPTSADKHAVCVDSDDHGLSGIRGVEAVAAVCTQGIEIDGRAVAVWGLENLRGDAAPEIVAGRAPETPDEVALGAVTLRAAHKHIGDRVTASQQGGTRTYRVVGRVVLPTIAEAQPLADSALFTVAGLAPILQKGNNETHYLLVSYAPGTNVPTIRRALTADRRVRNVSARPAAAPLEIGRVRQINAFPAVLAALLAILALVAVGHTLVTSVRRRRRELAVFKTIGFRRRQIAAAVAWQATTVGVIGLVVGIPVGLVIGRLVWRAVANSLGIAVVTSVSVWWLVGLAVATLALVNVLAFLPARAAARTKPAVALRAE